MPDPFENSLDNPAIRRRKNLIQAFSTPAPKKTPSYNRFARGGVEGRDGLPERVFEEAIKLALPDPKILGRAAGDPRGTFKGAAEVASVASPAANAYRLYKYLHGDGLAVTGADKEDIEQAVEVAGLIPQGKGVKMAGKAANAVLRSKAGIEFYRPMREAAGSGIQHLNMGINPDIGIRRVDDGEEYAREILRSLDEPIGEVPNRPTIQEAKDLVDAPQIVAGEPRARTRGSVPITIQNIDEANELLFGSNVRNTGSVGSTLSSDIYEGSQVTIGRVLTPERIAKDMLTVARKGVRERLGGRKARGSERPIWAQQTLDNFNSDFGEGTARVTNTEGRRSITGPYDDASTIPQTIQHDHTIVSPSDLKAFRDETDELFKAKKISREEKNRRKQIEEDMLVILQDPHNLIPVHRNTNILLISFDRERLLNDPEFASSLQISEDTLGDIWGIMSRPDSGYRKSVEQAYAWARRGRKGKRAESLEAWQAWQNSRVDKTLARRDQRLAQAGIRLS